MGGELQDAEENLAEQVDLIIIITTTTVTTIIIKLAFLAKTTPALKIQNTVSGPAFPSGLLGKLVVIWIGSGHHLHHM